jgi:hypothetical protein
VVVREGDPESGGQQAPAFWRFMAYSIDNPPAPLRKPDPKENSVRCYNSGSPIWHSMLDDSNDTAYLLFFNSFTLNEVLGQRHIGKTFERKLGERRNRVGISGTADNRHYPQHFRRL